MSNYQRSDVLRILRISGRQLSGWQRAGLVVDSGTFSFFDLLQLKKVRDLRAKKVRPAVIRQSLQAMQKQVAGMENPLLEASAFPLGSRIVFRHDGHTMEPIVGQFVLDFSSQEIVQAAPRLRPVRTAETVAEWFAQGVALEEDPARQLEAVAAYKRALELDPNHAAAHINLGTLYYNHRDYAAAEKHYRAAIAADARYALAYFDLGNVLDETGRLTDAVVAYRQAIQLAPTYADAHYNLALAFEKLRQPRRALKHWRSYVRLDSVGPWSVHARSQIQKILEGDKLRVVFRRK